MPSGGGSSTSCGATPTSTLTSLPCGAPGQLEAQRKADMEARAGERHGRQCRPTRCTSGCASAGSRRRRLRLRRCAPGRTRSRRGSTRCVRSPRVPQVEAELAQLNRDYDVIRQLRSAGGTARSRCTRVKIDQSAHMAEFRIVEPARVANMPVFPGQFVLGFAVLVGSIAAGIGVAYAMSVIRPVIAGVRELANSASVLFSDRWRSSTDKARAAARRDLVRVIGAAGARRDRPIGLAAADRQAGCDLSGIRNNEHH